MEIDLFTFIAQIVNFIILIALLNRFLFGPVGRAMAEREIKRAEGEAAARLRGEEAEKLAAKSRELLKEQEQDASLVMDEARAAAELAKQGMLAAAKKETDEAMRLWQEGMESEKQKFLDGLRMRSGAFAGALAEKVVMDLADEALSARITGVFVERIRTLDEKKAAEFAGAMLKAKSAPMIGATFAVPEGDRVKISEAIGVRLGYKGVLDFGTDPGGVCGLELKINGFKVSWTIRDYLDAMEEELKKVWEDGHGKTGEDKKKG